MGDPRCPFCDSGEVERVGRWGGQIITAQWQCRRCGSYFEAVRDDFDSPGVRGDQPADADNEAK